MKNKLSIKQIADLSGVSSATVSRVINHNGRFSEKTRQKVLKVIQDNHYQINIVAKSLRTQKSYTVGILVPDITNSFFAQLVQKIESYLFEKGYSSIICNTARSAVKESEYLKILTSKMVDGLILISGAKTLKNQAISTNIPVIYIDRQPASSKSIFISSDHYKGAVLATQHLLKEVERICFIAQGSHSSSAAERLKGFEDTVAKAVDIDSRVLDLLDYRQGEKLERERITSFVNREFAFLRPSQRLGIFANNDGLAINVLAAVHNLGLKIPEQVAIIGFDDSPMARLSYPQLTTVRQDIDLLAATACDKLLLVIKGKKLANEDAVTKLPVELILRATA
ncbi:LacI family DNA-binding transcriptional regulator [Oenococcus sp.]|uniref:LacI family DNA-binding transcriptional regulator n=1 Tax=Oenococcus sp. TaxID=1979414 RepID=UPI0039EACEBC